jgi:hypothetical protein
MAPLKGDANRGGTLSMAAVFTPAAEGDALKHGYDDDRDVVQEIDRDKAMGLAPNDEDGRETNRQVDYEEYYCDAEQFQRSPQTRAQPVAG